MSALRVLVTRAEPAASRTATRLLDSGFEPIVFPLFELADTGNDISFNGEESIIFTSANAIEILKRRRWVLPEALKTAWCVGKHTAAAAQDLGFARVEIAAGGGKALAETIEKSSLLAKGFVYPTTPDRSFDLASYLENQGAKVSQTEIYETREITPDEEGLEDVIRQCKNGVILVYSSRSGHHLMQCLQRAEQKMPTHGIAVVGISKASVDAFNHQDWNSVVHAEFPDEMSMFEELIRIRHA